MADRKRNPGPDVDKKTAKGQGEGGFDPHPAANDDDGSQGENSSKDQARHVTPPGKARSK